MKAAALVLAAAVLFLGAVLSGAWPGAGAPVPVGAIGMREAATQAVRPPPAGAAPPTDASAAPAADASAGPRAGAAPAAVPGQPDVRAVARTVGRFDAGHGRGDPGPGRGHDHRGPDGQGPGNGGRGTGWYRHDNRRRPR
jgi:hypothetical protein